MTRRQPLAPRLVLPLTCFTLLLSGGCSEDPANEDSATGAPSSPEASVGDTSQPLTYHRDVRALIEQKCAGCHQEGNIGPFALDNYDSVHGLRAAIEASVVSGSMPPWQPADGCNEYLGDTSLTDAERSRLLDWIALGAPEGDEADYVAPEDLREAFAFDREIALPEPYTPQGRPDDYRCFLMQWPETQAKFVTGFRMQPDRLDLVHHVLAYVVRPEQVADFQAMDDADPGPGYECFGGPNGEGGDAAGRPFQLGGWVPGASGAYYPAGTGIEVDPGSMIVVQMHYNSQTTEPGPDQSRLQVSLADSVERPAMTFLALNPQWLRPGGMPIPAGEANVVHEATLDITRFFPVLGGERIGLSQGDPFVIHAAGLHMHELGQSGRTEVVRSNGDEECLLDIPRWDFAWQGTYGLQQEVLVEPGDRMRIHCEWDNSATNQRFVEGEQIAPQDVQWGEGTGDEMCLSALFVTAP